jgi:transcriptional regulator with XRE-family HTH domain
MEDAQITAGLQVRKLREARGWSQEEVALRMVMYGYTWHRTAVAKTEAGTRPLDLNETIALAGVFSMTLEQFLSGAPDQMMAVRAENAASRAVRAEGKLARIRAILAEDD